MLHVIEEETAGGEHQELSVKLEKRQQEASFVHVCVNISNRNCLGQIVINAVVIDSSYHVKALACATRLQIFGNVELYFTKESFVFLTCFLPLF